MAHYKNVTRPLKLKSSEEVKKVIDKYFKDCIKERRPFTISGLCYSLGVCRDTLLYYQDKRHSQEATNPSLSQEEANRISDLITDAKARVAMYTEESLFSRNSSGAKFVLVNHFGFVDKTEVITTSKNDLENLTDEELEEIAKKLK